MHFLYLVSLPFDSHVLWWCIRQHIFGFLLLGYLNFLNFYKVYVNLNIHYKNFLKIVFSTNLLFKESHQREN